MSEPSNDKTRHRRLIKRLQDAAEPAAIALAEVLTGCGLAKPCCSGACPLCARAFQNMAFDLTDKVIREPARALRDRMTTMTIVPTSGCLPADDLSIEAVREVAAEISAALAAYRIPPSVAGMDISFNEDETGSVRPHWCVHAHVVGLDWLSDAEKGTLAKAFPASTLVRRPVHIVKLDLQANGRLYSFKPERVRRVSYLDSSNSDPRPFWNTHRRELRSWQAVELALVEHELGSRRRLITHGIAPDAVRKAFDAFYRARIVRNG